MWEAGMEAAKEGPLEAPYKFFSPFSYPNQRPKKLEIGKKEVNIWENGTNNIFKHEGYN